MEGRLILHCEVCATEAVQRDAEVTPKTGMLLISTHILHPFGTFRLFRKWESGKNINPEDETSYTTQYQEAFLQYEEKNTVPNIDD